MGHPGNALRRLGAASLVFALAACGMRSGGPAPVVSGETPAGYYGTPTESPRQAVRIRVERGQSLSMIAAAHHVPMRLVIEANRLTPPYRIEAGRTLVIPGTAPAPMPVYATPAPPQPAFMASAPVAAAPLSPRPVEAAALPPPASMPERLGRPANPIASLSPPPPVALQLSARAEAAPVQAARPEPGKPATATATPEAVAAPAAPAKDESAFLWPVRGRVLGTYGIGPDGTHNDGINIAAPRGAPVEAVDAGIVAYAGNELRGYGNLILLKHTRGWISAYAHCDLILAKKGQKVARGQVIARVGATGNVTEPQLHFELRRGNKPVDPREFLGPIPTAAAGERDRSG